VLAAPRSGRSADGSPDTQVQVVRAAFLEAAANGSPTSKRLFLIALMAPASEAIRTAGVGVADLMTDRKQAS
jgi:hypothetical protein